jgi:hypothetical protein
MERIKKGKGGKRIGRKAGFGLFYSLCFSSKIERVKQGRDDFKIKLLCEPKNIKSI